jgi:hypothetical protein
MDWIKLAKELNKLVPDWEYHIEVKSHGSTTILAVKNGMAYRVMVRKGSIEVYGVYPVQSPLDDKMDKELAQAPHVLIKNDKDEETVAIYIVGTFLPKYQRLFAELSGRIGAAINQRYSLANRLELAAGGMIEMSGEDEYYPEFAAHLGWLDMEGSVRSGKLVYLDMVVPGDVAEEILKLLALLKGA